MRRAERPQRYPSLWPVRVRRWLGFIESLARPGGNITGVVNQLETIGEKNLELLKEITPAIERVGIIHSPENVSSLASFNTQKEDMAPCLGLVAVAIPISKPADLDELSRPLSANGCKLRRSTQRQ